MRAKIKEFLALHETKIILFIGFILVAILSFEAGMMKGKSMKQNAIIVNSASDNAECITDAAGPQKASNLAQEAYKNTNSGNMPAQDVPGNCTYIGSKNSNKYHLPACRWAKNIKPENRVCFSDENQAQLKGYQPDKNCIK